SPGIGFLSNIVGVDGCEANPTKCSDISGIVTDDKAGTIEIKLKAPESDFLYVLSIPFTAVLPASTPQKDTENPPPAAEGAYFFMNMRLAPFNNLKARQAVNYAIDRQELVRLRGGLGVPTYNFLPPGYPQYKKITPDPYPYNLQKAKQLVQQSGTAGQKVTVY